MNTKPKSDYRNTLFIILMILLAFPLFQTITHFPRERSLKGEFTQAENPEFTLNDWFTDTFQIKKEKHFHDAFGFRGFFVRINNQISWSLFREVRAAGVIVGKENYLFGENYIKAWYGADYLGEDSIRLRISRLKYLQDQLREQYNKELLVVIAAGKGSYYPEYLPEYPTYPKGPTNYETHVKLASVAGLEILDFNRWFMENKTISPYPLYPKYGIHWSVYGAWRVADSILTLLESKLGIDLPSLHPIRIDIRRATGDDYDIGDVMNLAFKLPREKMAYPVLRIAREQDKAKPSVLVIADSFYWTLFKTGITQAFANSDFWYYNAEVFHTVGEPPGSTSNLDRWKEIQKHDVIILLATESNLPEFGWGFIEETYENLKKQNPNTK